MLWTLSDNLGTMRDVVDNTGAVISHYKYGAFGKVTSGDTTKTRFLYTAQEYDLDTGLVYYNARWYDPAAAKFLSQDPLGFAAGDANLTRYVANSPTNATDPTGMVTEDELDNYFELLYGEDGKKLRDAYKKSGGTIKIEPWMFLGKEADYEVLTNSGEPLIQINVKLDPAAAAMHLMAQLKQALARYRDFLVANPGSITECEAKLLLESYDAALKQIAARAAILARLYLAGYSVANEGVDFVITASDVANGDYLAAVGFLPLIPAGLLGKGGRILLKAGGVTKELDINVLIRLAEKLNITKSEDFFKLLQARKTLEANLNLAGYVRKAVTVNGLPALRGVLRGCDGGGRWRLGVLDRERRECVGGAIGPRGRAGVGGWRRCRWEAAPVIGGVRP